MKKLVCALLTLALVFSLSVAAFAASSEKDFSDFPGGWSHDAMKAAVDNGLLQGTNGKIDPAGSLTRAQMAAILVRAMGGTAKGDISSFTDAQPDAWYYNELSVAVGMKLIQGSGSLVRPNDPISRQEAAVVLARALCLKDGTADLSAYADNADVSSWAKGAVSALVQSGYMKGDGKNLNPTASITREAFAQLMYNMISTYYSAAGTYTNAINGNVVLKADKTLLDGVTVNGDVIVGDGVGNGTVIIKNSKISGRIVARGGGENSIIIINTAAAQIVAGRPDGALHISTEDLPVKADLVVVDGKDKVVADGEYNEVIVETEVPVVISGGSVQTINVSEDGADVTVAPGATAEAVNVSGDSSTLDIKGTVSSVKITQEASGAKVDVAASGTVNSVDISGTGASVEGTGNVAAVNVDKTAKETKISTPKTDITNNSTDKVTTNNGDLPSGGTGITNEQGGLNDGGSTGGGGGAPAPTAYYKLTLKITRTSDNEYFEASTRDNAMLSGSSKFYSEAISLITTYRDDLKNKFQDAEARSTMDYAMDYYDSSTDAQWRAYVSNPPFVNAAPFAEKLVSFADLANNSSYTVTYNGTDTYRVDINIAKLP